LIKIPQHCGIFFWIALGVVHMLDSRLFRRNHSFEENNMKAVRIHHYGEVEELYYEEAPFPAINADEILIKVHAAGVNPIDWKIREGYFKDFMQHPLPLTLGWDVAGEIIKVGSDVVAYQEQELVFGYLNMARQGAYANYVIAKADEISLKPVSLGFTEAAAIPLAALTAWQALFDVAKITAGQRVVIHAAAGGVGHFAVQLAKWKGAYVIGTASKHNQQFVLDLGADEFVDYEAAPLAEQIRDVDVVFDTVGGETLRASWGLLKQGGMLVSIVDPNEIEASAQQYGVRGRFVIVSPNGEQLQQIGDLVRSQQLQPHVSGAFSLEEAKVAHDLSKAGHVRGKLVLEV
jgi:NADPH:quinone reductase-like Zn-dependent oxidoreductase